MIFDSALASHQGLVRESNEDSAMASPRHLLLADGMGGHAAGEVASAVAVHIFRELQGNPETLPDLIQACGTRTRRALHAMSNADDSLETLGTTLISMHLVQKQYIFGHIGDSRAYLLRDGQLQQLTRDHTHVQRLIDSGQITAEAARSHPYRAMLLRSLDDHRHGPALEVFSVPAHDGDRILLCSDGLSDYAPHEVIQQALLAGTPADATEKLVGAALHHLTRDNVTVVVADVHDVHESTIPTIHSEVWNPRFAGAVIDGINISPSAQAALQKVLPAVTFNQTDPMHFSPALTQDPQRPPPRYDGGASDPPDFSRATPKLSPDLPPNRRAVTWLSSSITLGVVIAILLIARAMG